MTELSIFSSPIRRLGRMAEASDCVYMDWTASGLEVLLKGSGLWVEMEALTDDVSGWVCSTVDGVPLSRSLVERGRRWYPVFRTTKDTFTRRICLFKEMQSSGSCIAVYGIRYEGDLLPLPEPSARIEFIGDSITTAEGALAPANDEEYTPMWATAVGNYTYFCAQTLDAERRVLSRSGYGVAWDWQFKRENNMADSYDCVVGPRLDPESVARGCQQPYDFSSWKADFVCVRLTSNDCGGILRQEDEAVRAVLWNELSDRCFSFTQKIRDCNPTAKIVWISPSLRIMNLPVMFNAFGRMITDIPGVYVTALADYSESDYGARRHPNAAYHKRAGLELAKYLDALKTVKVPSNNA